MKQTVIFFLSLLSLLMIITKSYSQITYISGQVNEYASISGITTPACDPCNTSLACVNTITVDDGTIFSVGDRVLIVQMKGATVNTSNSYPSGEITAIGNAGNYEFFTIQAISGNDIYPSGQLVKTYDAAGLIQLVKVPYYSNDAEITSELTAPLWDRTTGKGGIVAIYVEGILTFNADINVKGKGYQGITVNVNGSPDNCSLIPDEQMNKPATDSDVSPKGHGVVVDDVDFNGGRAPRGNGGGGGVSGDSGGGGGSNFGAGGAGGWRWCDVDGKRAGGEGGVSMNNYIADNRIYFGGAGGPGFITNKNSAEASNGGGIVVVHAKHIVGNDYTIDASGDDVATPTGGIDGGGGGGGGGTVAFEIETYWGYVKRQC